MFGDMFVFDCVIHVYDLSDDNIRTDEPTAEHARKEIVDHNRWTQRLQPDGPHPLQHRWSVEEVYDLVFTRGGVDMAMAQAVPIYDWYKDWFAPVQTQYEMARKYPDQVLFCGGVDPIAQGLPLALKEIERQVTELGARSMKFYNGHLDTAWRCDDETIAYPMYEKCAELGINLLQFHKGSPFGKQNLEDLQPNDLQKAARDFPELNFVIHHIAVPYFDAAVNIASRFPNVYIALSGNLNASLVAPRMVQEQLGRLLGSVGPEKLLYGSEAALMGSPKPVIDHFLTLEIPEDLRVGYGYPQLADRDRRLILGENFARLMGVDIEAKKLQLAAS
jgi:predicted TIM-barrel fold metal-dependent hydrolase